MQFRIKVLNQKMAIEFLDIDASSEDEARRLAAAAGVRILDVRLGRSALGGNAGANAFKLGVFNQQLHSLLEAGQTVVDAIEVLGRNDRRDRNRAIYDSMLQSLKSGHQLSDAMAGLPSVFSPLYVAMVRASETTGTVRAAIRRYMQYQRQIDEIRGKVKAALTYPAILLSVGFAVISFLMLYVLPRFSAVYDDAGQGRHSDRGFVQAWGGFVRNNTALAWLAVAAIGAGVAAVALNPALRSAVLRRVLALPWIGERVWVLQLARLYRTLGMLLRSGINVIAALRMTRASMPATMHADLDLAIKAVSEGHPMSQVMREHRLSTEIAERLLLAGESSGNLDEMMERIADFYDEETAAWIDAASRIVEPVLMLVIGAIVGAIVLMLYSPIFDLANIV
ncbi:type II secretion system F family protein [Duganella sp. CY15W]|uniref:type II secretion system F family protein n=1 Tax=Duganella sp. CY15W TaxID=2692172 RepID=UPI00136C87A4|nr:type II secretion system F family protein [Duganella sp. CY15W]MYM27956.1 type II secretion system F family protein [Duganella sp. CY15W]